MKQIALFFLRAYKRLISPLLPPLCRFEPTCSVYAMDAISKYGFLRGSWLAMRRLARCHPLNPRTRPPAPEESDRIVAIGIDVVGGMS